MIITTYTSIQHCCIHIRICLKLKWTNFNGINANINCNLHTMLQNELNACHKFYLSERRCSGITTAGSWKIQPLTVGWHSCNRTQYQDENSTSKKITTTYRPQLCGRSLGRCRHESCFQLIEVPVALAFQPGNVVGHLREPVSRWSSLGSVSIGRNALNVSAQCGYLWLAFLQLLLNCLLHPERIQDIIWQCSVWCVHFTLNTKLLSL